MHLRLPTPPVSLHHPPLRIDQPPQLRPIRNPYPHLLPQHREPVTARPNFDHELGANPCVPRALLSTQRVPAIPTNPRRVGSPHRSIRQRKTCIWTKIAPPSVRPRPDGKIGPRSRSPSRHPPSTSATSQSALRSNPAPPAAARSPSRISQVPRPSASGPGEYESAVPTPPAQDACTKSTLCP